MQQRLRCLNEAQGIRSRSVGAILKLQTAKANLLDRSRIDFYGEIKKLEKQRREAEKAIEQWKVIERQSHFFMTTIKLLSD